MEEKKIRLLLVEDDKVDQMAFERYVKNKNLPYDYTIAGSIAEARNITKSMSFDIIIADYMLGDGTSFELFDRFKEIPVLVTTGSGTEEVAVEAMKLGAYDYIIKDPEGNYLKTLPSTVELALKRKQTEKELRNYQERLESMVKERTVQLEAEIVERKKAEEELHQYEHIVSSTSDMLALVDQRYVYLAVNAAYLKAFGKASDEMIGRTVAEVFGEEFFSTVIKPNAQRCLAGENIRFQDWFEFPDAGRKYMDLSYSPYLGPNNEIRGFVVIARDITELKQAEAQLQRAEKMEAIGTLAGGIAHDFNNILSSIIGYTELAMNDVEKDSLSKSNLQEVLRAGKRAVDLVKQILTFSREDKQEQKPFKVKYVIKEALKFLRASLPSTIKIDQNIQSDSLLMGDSTQIYQVLMNLCTNAGHAMEEKGGVLDVALTDTELDSGFTATHPGLKPGPFLKLTVTDTGYGMKPHVVERIFEPFFTTKQPGEGTGLGLSVVHGIVRNHGGGIYAYSEPGKGSTFHVYLPVIKRQSEEETQAERPVPFGTERILFVDDEAMLADLGEQVLKSLGYKVATRTSSTDALELFRKQPDQFDLVITDMTMPHMTGDILARELMKIRPDIPVILCTGYSRQISEENAKEIGIRAFIMKPILRRIIAETIREVLGD